jgi:drug/metabolite transporter (DMT)-like permease
VTAAALSAERQRRDFAVGIAFAVAASVGLGLAVAVSRWAYLGGTNAVTVAAMRGIFALAFMYPCCAALGKPLRMPRKATLQALGLGVIASGSFYGNIASVQYISVGLSALLFFTFPPMIALVSFALGERASLRKIGAVATSFAGLVLMLGLSAGELDGRGVALALLAAGATTANSILLQRTLKDQDGMVATFWMVVVAAAILVAAALGSGELQWPTAPMGWWGMAGVVFFQATCIPLWFLAIPRVGALRSGVVSNVQPVVSIVAAWLMFGEVLTPVQFAGGALVLGGVLLMQARRS